MDINPHELDGVVFDGVVMSDYPDFCDAHLSYATIKENDKWRPMTDEEIEWVNDHCSTWINEQINKTIF